MYDARHTSYDTRIGRTSSTYNSTPPPYRPTLYRPTLNIAPTLYGLPGISITKVGVAGVAGARQSVVRLDNYLPSRMPTTSPTLRESVYGMSEALERTFQLNRIRDSKPFTEKQIAVVADLDEFETYMRGGHGMPFDSVVYRAGKEICVVGSGDSYIIMCEETDRTTQVRVLSDPETTSTIVRNILSTFTNVPIRVRWVYNSKGDDVKLPIRTDNLPQDEFYPNLNGETLTSYYDRFMSSKSNILVLIGPPGTGKTSFIRGLLHHTRKGAVVSYDPEILKSDTIFTEFMSSNSSAFMVLEDADTFLSSRAKSGNTVMHKFLNVGDGLISTAGKKIVFSTNLPSIRDIDDALLRPGRCFDVLRFDKLTTEQAKAIKPEYGGGENAITLAELLNSTEKSPSSPSLPSSRVGFVS